MKALRAGSKYLSLLALLCVMTFPYSCEKSEDPEIDTCLGTVTDYDGNSYYTIQLGDQWWMINNLRTTHYANGTALPLIESILVWEALGYDEKAYCFYNNNEWKELEMFLGMTQAEADLKGLRGTSEGSRLANSSDLWLDGYLVNDSAFGTTGFIAQPAGGRHIYSSYTSIHRYYNVKSDGFSVRCVKDD